MLDLLHTAALTLRSGGFLAYLIPTPYDIVPDKDLPCHPCLDVILHCCQSLSTRHGRQLVIMRRNTSEYTSEHRLRFMQYKASVIEDSSRTDVTPVGFGGLLRRLQSALAVDAGSNETVVKQISKRCLKRKTNRAKQAALKRPGVLTSSSSAGAELAVLDEGG